MFERRLLHSSAGHWKVRWAVVAALRPDVWWLSQAILLLQPDLTLLPSAAHRMPLRCTTPAPTTPST